MKILVIWKWIQLMLRRWSKTLLRKEKRSRAERRPKCSNSKIKRKSLFKKDWRERTPKYPRLIHRKMSLFRSRRQKVVVILQGVVVVLVNLAVLQATANQNHRKKWSKFLKKLLKRRYQSKQKLIGNHRWCFLQLYFSSYWDWASYSSNDWNKSCYWYNLSLKWTIRKR